MRTILTNNLRDEVRKFYSQARDIEREQSLDLTFDASSARIESWLASQQSSPSQRAVRNEELMQLAHALASLPDDQRCAIELQHLKGYGLAEIANEMNRTKGAAAALLFRGLKNLRQYMNESDES